MERGEKTHKKKVLKGKEAQGRGGFNWKSKLVDTSPRGGGRASPERAKGEGSVSETQSDSLGPKLNRVLCRVKGSVKMGIVKKGGNKCLPQNDDRNGGNGGSSRTRFGTRKKKTYLQFTEKRDCGPFSSRFYNKRN